MELLFYIYLSCFVVGGAVVIMAAIGGFGADVGVDVEATELGEGVQFLSSLHVRKIFFFLCFFGLMGLLLIIVGGGICSYLTALKLFGAYIAMRPLLTLGVLLLILGFLFLATGLLGELIVFLHHGVRRGPPAHVVKREWQGAATS